jgi:SAM-dependent methyltransferase
MGPATNERTKVKATRGDGFLESWLATQRSRTADRMIPARLRDGRILDIGCTFLANTRFHEKSSLDQLAMPPKTATALGIRHETRNLATNPRLPFADETFSVVTLLAVIEHLELVVACEVLRETHRVLAPGGRVIVTTPAAWADRLLLFMAKLRIVSPEEIHEHTFAYRPATLGCALGQAGFHPERLRCGSFELWMNLWAMAEKEPRQG